MRDHRARVKIDKCQRETGLHENRFSFCHEESRNECFEDTYDITPTQSSVKMPHGRNGFGQVEAAAWPKSRHNFASESEWVKVSSGATETTSESIALFCKLVQQVVSVAHAMAILWATLCFISYLL